MSRVIHFEIHADDPQRAVNFYQHIFDWQINEWSGRVYLSQTRLTRDS